MKKRIPSLFLTLSMSLCFACSEPCDVAGVQKCDGDFLDTCDGDVFVATDCFEECTALNFSAASCSEINPTVAVCECF